MVRKVKILCWAAVMIMIIGALEPVEKLVPKAWLIGMIIGCGLTIKVCWKASVTLCETDESTAVRLLAWITQRAVISSVLMTLSMVVTLIGIWGLLPTEILKWLAIATSAPTMVFWAGGATFGAGALSRRLNWKEINRDEKD